MAFIEVLNGPEVGKQVPLAQEVFFIGRDQNNHLPLSDRTVSRKHAVINFLDGKYVINDLKSLKGLLINGVKREEGILEHGDEITIGAVRLRYHAEGEKFSNPFPTPRKKRTGLWLIIFLLLLLAGASFYLFQSGSERSDLLLLQKHYEQGLNLFNKERDVEGARGEWQKVLALDPKKETLYGQKALKLLENIEE